jgi:hypothetical protein
VREHGADLTTISTQEVQIMARTDSTHAAAAQFLDSDADVLSGRDYAGCTPALLANMERIARASRGVSAISRLLRVNIEATTGADETAPPPISPATVEGLLLAVECLADVASEAAEITAQVEALRGHA